MGRLSLEQIVRQCQQNDKKAFGLLYTMMHDRLRSICLHYVPNNATAEDLLHDAFILIFSRIGELKEPRKAEAWASTVTRNVCLLYLHEQSQHTTISLSEANSADKMTAVEPDPLDYKELLTVVDLLPEGYRRVFRLSVLEGMSHQQIAELLHIEPHTSSSQLYRAKLTLRRLLRPLVLLLLAVAIPTAVYRFMNQSDEKADTSTAKHAGTIETTSQDQLPVVATAQRPQTITPAITAVSATESITTCQTDIVKADGVQTDNTKADGTQTDNAKADGVQTDNTEEKRTPLLRPVPDDLNETPHETYTAESAGKDDNRWTLMLAYSGISNTTDMQLPYANEQTNDDVCDTVTCHHMPLTLSLSLHYRLNSHWQVGTGLQYTRLSTDRREGNEYASLCSRQQVNYIGIPVTLSWHCAMSRRISAYATAGLTLHLPLRQTLDSHYELNGLHTETATKHLHTGTRWAVGAGIGVHYDVTPAIGFFVEPSLQHYFRSNDGIETWWTKHPATLSVPFGLRFTF